MNNSLLDPFYPIFDSAEWLHRLVPLGIKLVQLRIKDKSAAELREEVTEAIRLCQRYDCQLVLNDYWSLAIDLGCDYIHLGQEDLDDADIAALRRAGICIGVSTHSDDELERALGVAPDYVALGPIYPTILKKMPWQPQGLTRIGDWKRRIGDCPLIAIGGLNLERATGVLNAGADVVSVVTDITLHDDPAEQVRRWIALTRPSIIPTP